MEHDFYAGFEGEPELVVEARLPGGRLEILRAWSGYFDALMARVPADAEGWTGIAHPYHLHTGWYEDDEWIDPDPADTRDKLHAAREACAEGTQRSFVDAFLALVEAVVARGGKLVLRLV